MCPDLERYRPYLAGRNLTREEEDRFIHTLYAALEKLADRYFAMDAMSLVREADEIADSFGSAAALDSDHSDYAIDDEEIL